MQSPRVVELSKEQERAVDTLISFPKRVQTLGGYAGTGKTTVIRTLKEELSKFAVCAFTGKAANVLRTKGVDASTIHSLIYKPKEIEYYDEFTKRVKTKTVFCRIPNEALDADGFIVDESSMVSRQIHDDLLAFDLPVIFVGDHGQLEPVGDKFNLMVEPDITLETIHRNAGHIARFAEHLRKGGVARNYKQNPKVRLLEFEQALHRWDVDLHGAYNQVIVAFNKSRVKLNESVRAVLEYPPDVPVVGDKVICLQNDGHRQLFNGMQGTVAEVDDDDPYRIRFVANQQDINVWVPTVPEQWNRAEATKFHDTLRVVPFDYAYAITCHKAQGDEFDKVLVFEQRCRRWDHRRWAYTAASRARRRVDWVSA